MTENFIPKYPSEFLLEFRSVDRFIYRVSDLYDRKDHIAQELIARLDSCHLYFLCTRPRLSLVPGTLQTTNESINFEVEYRIAGRAYNAGVEIPRNVFLPEEQTFEISTYPHRELIARDHNNEIVATTLLANYVHLMPAVEESARDLNVRYIGKGLRHSAQDRLEHHGTLQKILADINSKEPDNEAFALVYALELHKNALLFGTQSEVGRSSKRAARKSYGLSTYIRGTDFIGGSVLHLIFQTCYLQHPILELPRPKTPDSRVRFRCRLRGHHCATR